MEDLRLAIIVLGAFAILGVLIHGIWTIRKNKKAEQTQQQSTSVDSVRDDTEHDYVKISIDDPLLDAEPEKAELLDSDDDDLIGKQPLYQESDLHSEEPTVPAEQPQSQSYQYDEDDVGEVRLVGKQEVPAPKPKASEPTSENETVDMPEPPSSLMMTADDVDEPGMKIDTSIDVEKPTPKRATSEPKVTTETKKVGGKSRSFADKARKLVGKDSDAKSGSKGKSRVEKDQIRLELDESAASSAETESTANEVPQEEQEVLILSIKAPEGQEIKGAALLPALLTLGFKFGEHNMFHRHANSNGKGPKLFSLANMFNPGTFDIDNMENFGTAGLSLFMILPIEADPHQVFNMMHNAARKLADEFNAQILDGRRSVLTKQSLQQYVEKIREFERKRMIKRA